MAGTGLTVTPVPVLNDNYVWLVHDPESGETAAVDPSLGPPVLEAAEALGTPITQVLNTHWHPDHTGGNDVIRAATGCTVTGPAEAEKVSRLDRVARGGDEVSVGAWTAKIWEIPAHTAGHIALHFEQAGMIFVGDTLFAMGCGRLFEGTAAQMFDNMQRMAALPDDVRVYCGHEYTLANARFAITVDPDNAALQRRLGEVEQARSQGLVTLPTTIGEERATNPFMRAPDAEALGRLRSMKDSFG